MLPPLIAAALCLCHAPIAHAQAAPPASEAKTPAKTTLWLIDPSGLDAPSRQALQKSLTQALQGASGTHLVGEEAFGKLVESRRPDGLRCLWGKESCESADALVLDALGVALIVRLRARQDGKSFEASYALIDRRGRPDSEPTVRSTSWSDLGFAIVRQLYNATGAVAFDSTPQGATVLIDGAPMGKTPFETRLPIGRHAYTMTLERHAEVPGEVIVTAGKEEEATQVNVTMQGALSGLTFTQAPPGAQVFISGIEAPFDPLQPIELPPGSYTYQVQAKGYETVKGQVDLEPGMNVQRSAASTTLNPLFRDVSRAEIAHNHYIIQLSYAHSFQTTSFRGARAQNDGPEDLVFVRFVDDASTESGRFFDTNGIRLDLTYALDNFALTLLTLSYLTDTQDHRALIEGYDTGEEREVEFLKLSRLQLQPLQVHYRYIYKNLMPTVGLGLGVNFQWIDVKEIGAAESDAFSMSQNEAFWTGEVGINYFVTPTWFGSLRYNFHDHFNVGIGTEHSITFGVGGAFANIFGVEAEPPALLEGATE